MVVYTHVTNDTLITRKPCVLYSITFTNLGGNEARVNVYDSRGPIAADLVVMCTRRGYGTWQFSWKGLKLSKGLYVNDVERCASITIEWEHQNTSPILSQSASVIK